MPYLTPDDMPISYVCRRLRIPDDIQWLEIVNGALYSLIQVRNFELHGDVTPEDTAQVFQDMFLDYLKGEACLLGSIQLYSVNAFPDGILACDGATYLRTDYPHLYAVLPTLYIIDADHFSVPDLYQGSDMKYGIVSQ